MANCNECTKLDTIIEGEGADKNINHICTHHKTSVRYTPKRYKGYIWPCTDCDGKDFIKK